MEHGLTKGGFVGILLHRSCDFLVAMLGVFKAGGAYVPLDPTYPRERIRYMVGDSQAPFVITDATLLGEFSEVFSAATDLRVVLSLRGPDGAAVIGSNGVKVIASSHPGWACEE